MRTIHLVISIKLNAFLIALLTGFLTSGMILPAIAQVTSDGTTNTIVNPNGNNFTILNGLEKGNNLFHSFSNFSVPTSGSARFDLTNTPNITTIFSRVTGGNISNIDGLIQTLNSKNPVSLFLVNPNGIVFGQNTKLDISGSFVGTTASSIKFADGAEFSTVNRTANPLLTVSVPVGLGMGSNPGSIQVNGNGHSLGGRFPNPVTGSRGITELRIQPGLTLALIGGDITLNGGVLSGEGGLIHLGAVGQQNTNTTVSLVTSGTDWNFNYADTTSLAPIRLSAKALIDASGTQTGNIQLAGSRIDIANGSWVFINNRGSQTGGDIQINATELLTVQGLASDNRTNSRIFNYNSGNGQGGDVKILTQQLSVLDLANILTLNNSSGNGGNISVLASDSIRMENSSNGLLQATIAADTIAPGNAGNITLSTRQLTLLPTSLISSRTALSNGQGGSVILNASESIDLIGAINQNVGEATISSVSFGAGSAGRLSINTPRLRLLDGGGILAINVGSGSGGKILLNVSEALEIKGKHNRSDIGVTPSRITTSTDIPSANAQRFFGLSPVPSGASGTLKIITPYLILDDTAQIRVRNQGRGNGGELTVDAEQLLLTNNSQILATTNSGSGGSVTLYLKDSLLMRNGSLITTEAKGTGNAGNITINSPTITKLENSDISANAAIGQGGNVTINTQGLFQSMDSNITASGTTDGQIKIITPAINQENSLQEQKTNFVNTETVVANNCLTSKNAQGGSFVVTGNGGLPEIPNMYFNSPYELVKIQAANLQNSSPEINEGSNNTRAWKVGDPIVEARSLQVVNGKLLLTSANSSKQLPVIDDLTCKTDE